MNIQRLIVPFLLCVFGALYLFRQPPPLSAQSNTRRGWEYKAFALDPRDYEDKQDYRSIVKRLGIRKAQGGFHEHVLNHLGKEGWELVTFERRANMITLYLKRPAS